MLYNHLYGPPPPPRLDPLVRGEGCARPTPNSRELYQAKNRLVEEFWCQVDLGAGDHWLDIELPTGALLTRSDPVDYTLGACAGDFPPMTIRRVSPAAVSVLKKLYSVGLMLMAIPTQPRKFNPIKSQ